jgi:hypothetical protein
MATMTRLNFNIGPYGKAIGFYVKTMSAHGSHLGWRSWSLDTILKGTHQGTIPARFGLIWFSGFRGEDLNVIFYQAKNRKKGG